ncbi:MAG: RagB/SusD family nutrient uptake outer membrane protein [Prevotella sp.]|nr:RagB/SusD family nutrient uptake outer membrane protein [Prevotella sp.]MCH3995783.1 RagB/SusD family nutrient uptake outer membrane protein [Prevotella sp.]
MRITKFVLPCLLMAGTAVLSTSCSDYLDEEKNFNQMQTEDKIFTNKEYTEQWLAYCYANLLGDNMEVGNWTVNVTNYSDDIIFNEGYNGTFYRQLKLGEYTYFTDNSYYAKGWSRSYDGIRQASILINNIDRNTDLTQAERTDIKGQARFLRAYFYWLLLRRYGPVPIMPDEGADYTKTYDELSYPRSTYDKCAEYIADQMAQAARELPATRSSTQIARPTRGAALAMRAKAYLYDASPLANGNKEESDFVDDKGTPLISQTYDESKWARAAAAALDVINLNQYKLYTASKKESTDFAYPTTIAPPYNAAYSDKNFPDGWADIDPFESYRAIFDGDLIASENPEMIFTRGVNDGDNDEKAGNGIKIMALNAMPSSAGGYNCHGLTQKQCDAYDMADGKAFDRSKAPKKFTDSTNVAEHPYDHLQKGVWMEYANREPRFYASVGFNGAVWPCVSAKDSWYQNLQVWYYRGQADGQSNSSERWIPTGIGMMKFVNPSDCNTDNGSVTPKAELTIRYADILLMYAEALNELKGSYQVKAWDGSRTYTIKRDINEMRKGIKPVRMRAGVPDYDEATYSSQSAFRTKLKHERQVEFLGENQRYFDLRRWKDAPKEEGSQIYGCNTLMTKDHAAQYYVPVRVPYLQTAFSKKMYFWPVLQEELKRDKRMTQAPGWKSYE